VFKSSGFEGVAQIRLAEEIFPTCRVVIRRDRNESACRVYGPGNVILIKAVIVAVHCSVSNVQIADLLLKCARDQMHICIYFAVVGVAVIGRDRNIGRFVLERCNAAVRGSLVSEKLICKCEARIVAGRECERRSNAIPAEFYEIPETIRSLRQTIDTKRELVIYRLIYICSRSEIAKRPSLHRYLARWRKRSFLGHAVEDAASASAPEDKSIRAADDLDALKIVGVAQILNIVANAVHKKIRTRALPADDYLVAVILALVCRDTWLIPNDIAYRR